MKNRKNQSMDRVLSIVLLLFLSVNVCGQNVASIRCYYEFVPANAETGQPARTDTMCLLIGNTMSEFFNPAKQGRDSLFINAIKSLDPSTIQSISVLKGENAMDISDRPGTTSFSDSNDGESYRIFKNRMKNTLTYLDYTDAVSGDRYQYEDDLGSLPWKILSETESVLNYSCQKASLNFRGRDYIAWFSTDIPVSDGPWKFMGLPGLILKIADTGQLFSFEIIGIEQLGTSVPIRFEEGKFKCSRKQFEALKKKQSLGSQININGGVVTISTLPETYNYNPIELD